MASSRRCISKCSAHSARHKSPEPSKVAKKETPPSNDTTSPPSSLFPSSLEGTKEEEEITLKDTQRNQSIRQKRALPEKGLAECVVNITPNSRVTKTDLKTAYTPKSLSTKVASQTRAKKNLLLECNDSEEADEDSEIEVPVRETKTRGRKGRSQSNTSEQKTIVEETESEEDEVKPSNAQRGRGLRSTQSTNSIHTKKGGTRSKSTHSNSGANSSMDSDVFLSPLIKGKAFLQPRGND